MVTPFRGARVDYDALENLIDWQLDSDVDALVILGTSAPAQKLFGGGWVRTMGSMSFSVYAWHLTGIVALSILSDLFGFGDWLFSLRGMLVFLLCMWVFAAFSHFCIEKPIARCTDRLLEKL